MHTRKTLKPHEVTEKIIETEESNRNLWLYEWTIPKTTEYRIIDWYSINIDWQVIWKTGNPLKYFYKKENLAPYVALSRIVKSKDWEFITKQKEHKITELMHKYFWPYIINYSNYVLRPDEFIVVPKDSNWDNLSLQNLEFVNKKEFYLQGTEKWRLIKLFPFLNTKTDQELADMFNLSRGWVNRIRTELKEAWKIWDPRLKGLVISKNNEKVYIALLECNWLKSNLELAKDIWAEENFDDKENKERLTDKISRVRKKLLDKWLIEKYNTYGQKVNISDVREELLEILESNSKLPKSERQTHQQIANRFSLKKGQVDNFSRTLKK